MRRLMMGMAIAGSLAAADGARACGACVEDKIAATYDHAVMTQAMRRHQQVVFVAVEGPRAESAGPRLAALARNVQGVEPASVRSSASPAALSFAIDAKRPPQAAVATLRARFGDPATKLTLIRIARDGVLVEPK